MEQTTLGLTDVRGAAIGVQAPGNTPSSGFELEYPEGATRQFDSMEDVRTAILSGEIPKTASIHRLGNAADSKPAAVEQWARANEKLRSLYIPIWSHTLQGALIGMLVVAVLKALDTLVLLFTVNPAAAILWLVMTAALFSPKWKIQMMVVAYIIGAKSGVNVFTLMGTWAGILAFAAVFGISAGMTIGTIAGYLRRRRVRTAPDAAGEGLKPVIWGLAVPGTVFMIAAVVYVQVLLPALLSQFQG